MRTRVKVYDAADNIKPYVERAMADEKLRDDVMRAFKTARELYSELIGDKDRPVKLAARVATDDDVRDRLRDAIEDLRKANDRLQGRKQHRARKKTLIVGALALGILLNPVTGPDTRKFIRDMVSGGNSGGGDAGSNGYGG